MTFTDFWDSVTLTKRLYDGMVQPICLRYSLTRMELDILLFLANNPEFDTAGELVARRKLTKSHVSTSVRALAARGYLTSFYRGGNRKSVHLRLCNAAGDAVRAGQAAQRRFNETLLDGFTPDELHTMETNWARLLGNLRGALTEGETGK